MIIDLDSLLREGYFMDEVYKLGEPFAQFTPRKANDEGRSHGTRFNGQKAKILGGNAEQLLNL